MAAAGVNVNQQGASYIIGKDDTTYYAIKASTGAMAYSGSVFSTVLQSCITDITEGVIALRPYTTYTWTAAVTGQAGIFIEGNGAAIDLTTLDDCALTLGADGTWAHRKKTGIQDVYVTGATGNLNTKLIKVVQVDKGALVRNVHGSYLNNVAHIRGACYDAAVENITSAYAKGVIVEAEGFFSGTSYAPNGARINHIENSGSSTTAGSCLVKLTGGATAAAGSVHISDCYSERMETGIYVDGYAFIYGCNILTDAAFAGGYGIRLSSSASKNLITGCRIAAQNASAVGISLEGTSINAEIVGNLLDGTAGKAVSITATPLTFTFSGNQVLLSTAGSYGIYATSTVPGSIITANKIWGSTGAHRGTGVSLDVDGCDFCVFTGNDLLGLAAGVVLYGDYGTITGNMIRQSDAGILSPNFRYGIVQSNSFYANTTTVSVGATTKVRNNAGWITENSGTSTGTGAQQTIAHGLSATPTRVFLSESTTGGALAYQSTAADATNIYVTATNTKTYQWEAKVV